MRPKPFPSGLVLSLSACVVLAASVTALASNRTVDPSTLNPPPPPAFNPVCESVGSGTICTVNFSDPPFAGGSGIVCGSGANAFELLLFQTRTVTGRRYYDENGNLLRRHFHEEINGTLTNPVNHLAVSFTGGMTHLHDLAIPGDNTSGTESVTGSVRTFLPQGGTVLIEAGRLVQTPDGVILSEQGPHPVLDSVVTGDPATIQPLCDALQ